MPVTSLTEYAAGNKFSEPSYLNDRIHVGQSLGTHVLHIIRHSLAMWNSLPISVRTKVVREYSGLHPLFDE
jgi:hypothetical protein